MPFLVLPASRAPGEALLADLATRLCPYDAPPRRAFAAAGHEVWATSLARREEDGVASALPGTAAFAVRREADSLLVTTDPLGTCPVWYARVDGGWAVSPEAKALARVTRVALRPEAELLAAGPRPDEWTPYRGVARLAPGASLRLAGGNASTEGAPWKLRESAAGATGVADVADVADVDRATAALGGALSAAGPGGEGPSACHVSGGIDSAIACALARRRGAVSTFTLGTELGDEYEGARALAEGLGCMHREVRLEPSAVLDELRHVVVACELFDGLTAEIALQLSVLHRAAAGAGSLLACTGYGSDLLFDGMLRHRAYMEAVGLRSTPELIRRTRWTGELAPFAHWALGLGVEHVFWRPSVLEAALAVPRELCFVDGVEKHVLREAAVRAGLLPRALAFRPKTGMTDGTGVDRLLSDALGLSGAQDYRGKSRACIELLSAALA